VLRHTRVLDRALEQTDHELSHRFVELEENVSDEPVGDEHVATPANDLPSLDVADEVEARVRREELKRLLRALVALLRLLSDVQQPDTRTIQVHEVLGVDVPEMGELPQMKRLTVDVGSCVEQEDRISRRWKHRPHGRAVDALEGPEDEK
jgi:hypothetical protein